MIRVNEDLFDFKGDQRLYNGRPFTGIAFYEYPNQVLKRELYYKDGLEEGVCREWHPNGQLKREWFAVRGRATGRVSEWHPNGKLQSVSEYHEGDEVMRDEWNAAGDLILSRRMASNA